MTTQAELVQRIKALEDAGLDATAERAELGKLTLPVAATAAKAKAATTKASASVATGEAIEFDEEVDVDSFESGGQAFGAPEEAGVYSGVFQDIITPSTKTDQRWWLFKTDDARVEAQLGKQVRSALIVSPKGQGAFKLKDILDGLAVAYTLDGSKVSGSVPRGLACMLEYQEVTLDGKTQMRLQNVWAAGTAEQVI